MPVRTDTRNRRRRFSYVRYPALIQLWSHHNSTQLQWPPVAITTAVIALSVALAIVDPAELAPLTQPSGWGHNLALNLRVGIPLSLAGVAAATLSHVMGRSRMIMRSLEKELESLERNELGDCSAAGFSNLNHPSGVSGALVIRLYVVLLATGSTFLGMSVMLGLVWGPVAFTLLTLPWVVIEPIWLHRWFSRVLRVPQVKY